MNTNDYPLLTQFQEGIQRNPITRGCSEQIVFMAERYKDDYCSLAERVLQQALLLGLDSQQLFTQYIIDYLREMSFFLKNGGYGRTDFIEVKKAIYDNNEVMLNTYMPGLFLAYGFTTILYAKYDLFRSAFTPRLSAHSQGVEAGFGEGFYLWELSRQVPGIRVKGFDISSSALTFAAKLLNSAGYTNHELKQANLFEGLPIQTASQDWAILAEVIEHIPEPQKGIEEMARVLKPGGIIYLTTVIDSNHMDHIVNFESPAVVEEMLQDAGLQTIEKSIYKIQDDFPDSPDKSIGLAFVCERMETLSVR